MLKVGRRVGRLNPNRMEKRGYGKVYMARYRVARPVTTLLRLVFPVVVLSFLLSCGRDSATEVTPTPTVETTLTTTADLTSTPLATSDPTRTVTPEPNTSKVPRLSQTPASTSTPTPTGAAVDFESPTPTPTRGAVNVESPTPTPTRGAVNFESPTPTPTSVAPIPFLPTPTPTLTPTATPIPLTLELLSPQDGTGVEIGAMRVLGRTRLDAVVAVNGVPVDILGDGTFQHDLILEEGANLVEVVAADLFGRTESRQVGVFFIASAAGLPFTLLYPPDGIETTEPMITVVAVSRPDAVVGANGIPLDVNALGIFSITLPLEEGGNLIEVVAADIDGNVRFQTVAVFYLP